MSETELKRNVILININPTNFNFDEKKKAIQRKKQ